MNVTVLIVMIVITFILATGVFVIHKSIEQGSKKDGLLVKIFTIIGIIIVIFIAYLWLANIYRIIRALVLHQDLSEMKLFLLF